ncbi:hypothetical protein D3C84_1078720 [compost metagenome]
MPIAPSVTMRRPFASCSIFCIQGSQTMAASILLLANALSCSAGVMSNSSTWSRRMPSWRRAIIRPK